MASPMIHIIILVKKKKYLTNMSIWLSMALCIYKFMCGIRSGTSKFRVLSSINEFESPGPCRVLTRIRSSVQAELGAAQSSAKSDYMDET